MKTEVYSLPLFCAVLPAKDLYLLFGGAQSFDAQFHDITWLYPACIKGVIKASITWG